MTEVLRCVTQSYAWGRKGSSSEVGRLKRSSDADFELDDNKPYAELWMGTHPSGPSRVGQSNILLSDYLKDSPELVGLVPPGYPNNDLPFLFKVLSVQTALSIQSHPDKAFAPILHRNYPEHYKDPNHKPEMVVAVTPFEAMCGFRSIDEIRTNAVQHPELRTLMGEEAYSQLMSSRDTVLSDEDQRALVKKVFVGFMTCDDTVAAGGIASAIERFASSVDTDATNTDVDNALMKLILRLHADYPGDRGVLAPLLLNVLYLQPGQSFFMGPNEPHAYLFGDCVECMALSDNVVRAGLTPKFKHVDVLCGMLHYRCGAPALIEPVRIDEHTTRLRPDPTVCVEFELDVTKLTHPTPAAASGSGEGGESAAVEYTFPSLPCASLLLVLRGRSVTLKTSESNAATAEEEEFSRVLEEGTVLFLPAHRTLTVVGDVDSDEEVVIFRAHVNLGSV